VLVAVALVACTAACSARTVEPDALPPSALACSAGDTAATECFEIVWTGDILLASAAQRRLDEHGYSYPFEHVASLIDADYSIGNAEGPITEQERPAFRNQKWSYNAQPEAAAALGALGFDALGLANNHLWDRGRQGIEDTIRYLDEAGVETFGAGINRAEAERPLLIATPHGTLAVVGFGAAWSEIYPALKNRPGLIPLDAAAARRGHELATAAGARWVVAYVHWGRNYSDVTEPQPRHAALLVEAGYDLVVGHHSHTAQTLERIDGVPVLYSLGNFAFGTSGRFKEAYPGHGLVARGFVGPDGFAGLELSCIETDNRIVRYQPRPCSTELAAQVFERVAPDAEIRDGVAWIPMR